MKIQYKLRLSRKGNWTLSVWEPTPLPQIHSQSYLWKLNLPLTAPEEAENMLQIICKESGKNLGKA